MLGLLCGTSLITVLTVSSSEKLKEDDYDDIPDDPSVPVVSMEVDQVTLSLVGEAGRSSGEVNTTSVKTIRTQDERQTVDFLFRKAQFRGLPL